MKEVIRKLYTAGWAPDLPDRCDLTLHIELIRPPQSEAEIRSALAPIFQSHAGGQQSLGDAEELEYNVRRALEDQKHPRRIVKRIRRQGGRERVDMAFAQVGEQFTPERRFDYTYVQCEEGSRTQAGYRCFTYGHMARAAVIERDDLRYAETHEELPRCPGRFLVMLAFGRKAAGPAGSLVPDESKLQAALDAVASGNAPLGQFGLDISVSSESTPSGEPADRIELRRTGDGELVGVWICDRRDYRRAFRTEAYFAGRLVKLREADSFDDAGFPAYVRLEEYDEQGNLREADYATFLRVDPDPVFTEDVFEFNPPPGYSVVDARESPSRWLVEKDPQAPHGGETLGEALGLGPGEPLPLLPAPRRGSEFTVDLGRVTSRPATQPAAGATTRPAP